MSKKNNIGKNILEKIVAVIREDSRALRAAVMDQTGSRLHEKQISSARDSLKQAKTAIAEELAKELQASRQVRLLDEQVTCQEQLIIDAMKNEDESLAFELATEMVALEQELKAKVEVLKRQQAQLKQLTRHMEFAERELQELERQMAMVKTTEDIQKATDVITGNLSKADSKMLSARKTLERIRKKQQIEHENNQTRFDLNEEKADKTTALTDQSSAEELDPAVVLQRILDKD